MNEEKQRELEASLSCFSFGWLAGCCCFLYFDKEFRLDFVVVVRKHREKPVSVCVSKLKLKLKKSFFLRIENIFFFSCCCRRRLLACFAVVVVVIETNQPNNLLFILVFESHFSKKHSIFFCCCIVVFDAHLGIWFDQRLLLLFWLTRTKPIIIINIIII